MELKRELLSLAHGIHVVLRPDRRDDPIGELDDVSGTVHWISFCWFVVFQQFRLYQSLHRMSNKKFQNEELGSPLALEQVGFPT